MLNPDKAFKKVVGLGRTQKVSQVLQARALNTPTLPAVDNDEHRAIPIVEDEPLKPKPYLGMTGAAGEAQKQILNNIFVAPSKARIIERSAARLVNKSPAA